MTAMHKILIVEDDPLLMRMLERVFTFEGFAVEKATDGAGALAKLIMSDSLPSAILMDILLPVLSGMEVLKKIKESENLKHIPVVILTNLSPDGENEEKIMAAGASLCLLKTQYTPSEVVRRVRTLTEEQPER